MKEIKLARRDFLKKTAAAAVAFTIVPRHVLGDQVLPLPATSLPKV